MREVQASDAKAHFPQLLDDIERGETVIITRHGRPIARIVPEAHLRQEEIDKAIEGNQGAAQAHRKDHGGGTAVGAARGP